MLWIAVTGRALDDASRTNDLTPCRVLCAHLGCDGLRRVRVGSVERHKFAERKHGEGMANDGRLSDPRCLSGEFSAYSRWLYGKNAEHEKHCDGFRRRNCSVRKVWSANKPKVY